MPTLHRWPKVAITGVILIFLSAQVIAIALPIPAYYWPFTDYPMYSPPHFEGEAVNPSYTIIGIHTDGTEETTHHRDFGFTIFQHQLVVCYQPFEKSRS